MALIRHFDLRDFSLLVHDFGGPIGLPCAIEEPERVRGIVLFNTWMWSLAGDPHFQRAGKLVSSPLGRFLYRRMNFSPRVVDV